MIFRALALAVSLALASGQPGSATAAEITVFAASSLKDALDAIAADWQTKTGDTVVISYGGSSALANQIEQGAEADIFISAAVNWMDTLQNDGLIKPDTRRNIVGNTLVLIAHGTDAPKVEIAKDFDLAGLLAGGKLSMAMVDSVPAGQYGKEALTHLGAWPTVEASVAQSENVRAAMTFVATGEAPFGIVYASDAVAAAAAHDQVSVAGIFPAESHKPIVYPAALVKTSNKRQALAFLDALGSDAAVAVFKAKGFDILK